MIDRVQTHCDEIIAIVEQEMAARQERPAVLEEAREALHEALSSLSCLSPMHFESVTDAIDKTINRLAGEDQ